MGGRRRRVGRLLTVAVDGFHGSVHVREDGPGTAPPIVLLHGFSGSMHWLDPIVPLLSDRFRVVRVDLLGHGSTGGPAADAPLQARVVQAVLEDLAISGATAVGHSFGADVAVELAERSDRVDRLVIVAQAPDYTDATLPRGSWVMTVPGAGHALGRFFQTAAMVAGGVSAWKRRDAVAAERAAPRLAEQGLLDFRALRVGMFRIVLVERRDRMARRPLDDQVRAAGKPTFVLLGGRDHFYGARSESRYRAAGAEVHVLPDSGHSPLVETPAESARLIAAFAEAGVTS